MYGLPLVPHKDNVFHLALQKGSEKCLSNGKDSAKLNVTQMIESKPPAIAAFKPDAASPFCFTGGGG